MERWTSETTDKQKMGGQKGPTDRGTDEPEFVEPYCRASV